LEHSANGTPWADNKEQVETVTRTHWILLAAGLMGLGGVGKLAFNRLAAPNGGTFTFCFPANQMSANAVAFRRDFVDAYLKPQAPYPIFTAMYHANIAPESKDDEMRLGRRGPFIFMGPSQVVNSAPPSACDPAASPLCTKPIFPFELGGKMSRVQVDLLPTVQVSVSDGTALVFDFGEGIPIHFLDPAGTGLPGLRKDMTFRKISISDRFLEDVLFNPGSSGGTALTLIIRLDLQGNCH
jgi:hypothetical protein